MILFFGAEHWVPPDLQLRVPVGLSPVVTICPLFPGAEENTAGLPKVKCRMKSLAHSVL